MQKAECSSFHMPPSQPNQQPAFVLNDGEFIRADFDIKRVNAEWAKIGQSTVNFLNSAESFAIPFAAGVADDAIGFQETASAFCLGISRCLPAIFYLKQTEAVPFKSALTLFCVWNNRKAAQVAAPLLQNMQQVILAAEKNKIKPI